MLVRYLVVNGCIVLLLLPPLPLLLLLPGACDCWCPGA